MSKEDSELPTELVAIVVSAIVEAQCNFGAASSSLASMLHKASTGSGIMMLLAGSSVDIP